MTEIFVWENLDGPRRSDSRSLAKLQIAAIDLAWH
jgi:hypothetical protein